MSIWKKLLSGMIAALCLVVFPAVAEAEEALLPGCIYQVQTAGNLVLRVKPDWRGDILERVENGTRVRFWDTADTYARVQTETGRCGYIPAGCLVPARDKVLPRVILRGDATVIGTEDATLTVQPKEHSVSVKALPPGTPVTVMETQGDYVRVSTGHGLCGYLPIDSLSPGRASSWDGSMLPASGSGSVWITETPDYVGLRSVPNQDAEPFLWLLDGQEVTVLGFEGRFALVEAAGRQGYAYACDLQPAEAFHELKTVRPTASYSYKQMRRDAEKLARRYGNLTVGSLGLSVQGREITLITLGDPHARRHVLIQAAIHGREHMSALLAMSMLEYALACPGDSFADGTVAQAMADTCFYIVPMANPDGVTIAQSTALTEGLNAAYLNDRNAGRVGSVSGYLARWKSNANGVDLNRNFDAAWSRIPDDRNGPSSESFKGHAAADQPETRALVSFTRSHKLDATVSLHASGSTIYAQFGDREAINARSLSLGRAIQAITGFTLNQQSYDSAGGYKDWVLDELGIPSLTVEIGCKSPPLPVSEFSSVYQRCRQLLPAVAHWLE